MTSVLGPKAEAERLLTQKECQKVIGGIIGSLCEMAGDVDTVRRAVEWWLSSDPQAQGAWNFLKQAYAQLEAIKKMQTQGAPVTGKKPD
jgi:hypothetical protein